jgi:hypothetical protein
MTYTSKTHLPKRKRGRWFKRRTHVPKHVGVYELLCPHQGLDYVYAHWNGQFWSVFSHSPNGAMLLKDIPSFYEEIPWRGLLK